MTVVDPPDLKLWPTLRHLFPLWWAQRRLVAIGLTCALVFTGLSLTIPILIQRTIDDAIDGGDHSLLLPYLGAITLIAAVRFGVNFTRRYATARVGIAVEARLRGMMYDAYLRFPRAFYDRHATGEVISRATNDIYPVRYFIGWGVVQAIQSMMMLVGAAIVLMLGQRPPDAVCRALDAADRGAHVRLRPQGVPDLAHRAGDEGAPHRGDRRGGRGDRDGPGVRARGRRPRALHGRAEAVRHETMRQAGVEARFLPGLIFLPSLGIAAVLLFGGRDAIAGHLTIGQFTLFITLLLQLVWPLEALGWIINLGAARDRRGLALVRLARLDRAASRVPSSRGRCPTARSTSGFENVHFSYGVGKEVLLGIDLDVDPGEIVAVCGATGAGKTSLLNLLPRFYDPPPGACCSAASTAASWRCATCAARSRSSRRSPSSSRSRSATTSLPPDPTLTGWRCSPPARRRASRRSWTSSPTATTPSSANAGSTSRAGSASGSRLRARSSRVRA